MTAVNTTHRSAAKEIADRELESLLQSVKRFQVIRQFIKEMDELGNDHLISLIDDISFDKGLHADDDRDEILNIIAEELLTRTEGSQ